jgi:hypothetical protein
MRELAGISSEVMRWAGGAEAGGFLAGSQEGQEAREVIFEGE